MSMGMPWVMGLAALGAFAIAALHLLSVREPLVRPLPTARFVPGGDARAVARQPRLTDRRLLALRVLAVLAFGAAFSGLHCGAASRATVELVYVAPSLQQDSLQWRGAVPADSARTTTRMVAALPGVDDDPGIAIVQGLRDASRIAMRTADVERISLTLVLPPAVSSLRGWAAWRSQWPAEIRVVVHGEAQRTVPRLQVDGGAADDPVGSALRSIEGEWRGDTTAQRLVRIIRDTVGGGRRDTDGTPRANITVSWPRSGIPTAWEVMAEPDTVGAIAARGRALVGPFVRRARFVAPMRLGTGTAAHRAWRPIAWWSDGEIAAIERTMDQGCERQVAVAVPNSTDLLLSPSARGLLDALVAPCGGGLDTRTLIDSGATRPTHLPADSVRQRPRLDPSSDPVWLMPLFLMIGLAALGAEWWWRVRSGRP